MSNGISKGTLLLLGGAAALLMSPSTRRRVVDVAGEAIDGAQTLLEETIVPTAYDVAARAGDLTEEARKRALMAQDDLHDYLAEAQKEVERRRRELIHDTADTRRDLSKKAVKAQAQAARSFMGFRHDAEEFAEDARKQAGRKLKEVRKEGRKGLLNLSDMFGERVDDGRKMVAKRAVQAGKTVHKLDKHARKEIQGYQKEIARLEQQLERQAGSIKRSDIKLGNLKQTQRSGMGSLLPLLLLAGAGAVVMVPSLRKPVEDALEGVSPEAAEYLRKAGEVAGKFWVEDMPPATPSAAAKPAQANASAAAASVAPDSPAAIKPAADSKPTDAKPADTKVDTSKPADVKPTDSKVDTSKPEDKKEADKK